MLKQYFFQAGSFEDLSHAELVAVFEIFDLNKDIIHKFSNNIFLIKSNNISEDVLLKIFNRLGGFVRFGYLIDDLDTFLETYLKYDKKVIFGLSILGQEKRDDFKFLKNLGNELKKGFKEYSIPSRFLFPRNKEMFLNAAQILNNDILEKGFELCILRNGKEEIYGKTIAIQDVEGYIKRDTERPYSDIKMGVLPPKLARIMINLAALKEGTVWDPFCGSGTIPMESAVLGYNFFASDSDENSLFYTEENIKWLNKQGFLGNIVYETFNLDVTNPEKNIVKKLKSSNISAIVCEPFMGPPQKKILSAQKAQDLIDEVKSLYVNLFSLIDDEIKMRNFKMILIIPSYKTINGWRSFSINEILNSRWKLLNSSYSPDRDLKWNRKNSIITRNIFILYRT